MATRKSKQAQGARSYKQGSEFEMVKLPSCTDYFITRLSMVACFLGRQVDVFLK